MNFCSLVLELYLTQNFCHTDRHFPETVKMCSGHPKTFKFIKHQKSKICTKQIHTSIYVEKSKNELKVNKKKSPKK